MAGLPPLPPGAEMLPPLPAGAEPITANAQTAARHQQQTANVDAAHKTIASDPMKLSLSSDLTNRPHTIDDPFAAHINGLSDQQRQANLQKAMQQTGSALNRVGTAASAVTMTGNYAMREIAGDKNLNAQIKQIITQGGIFGDPGKKLDQLGALLNFNSPGEVAFWTSQPGVHDALMNAKAKTPEGAAMQLLLGMHSDFARFKQGHPVFTSMETFAGGMMDPTAWLLGTVAGKVAGAAGRTAAEAGEAATAAARNKAAGVHALPNTPLTDVHTQVRREGPNTTTVQTKTQGPPITFQKPSLAARAGAAVGRTFPEQTKQFGAAYTKLVSTLQDDAPLVGDRFAAARREYGSYGEWAHNKMVNDHSLVPMTTATQMMSNDLFGGLSRDQKVGTVHAIEDLPDILGGKKDFQPDHKIPVQGVPISQRAQNWSEMQMAKLKRYQTLMPKTFQLMMQPKTYGTYEGNVHDPYMGPHNENAQMIGTEQAPSDAYRFGAVDQQGPVTPLQVSDWFPRQGAWDRPNARPGMQATGQQGGLGLNIKQRTMGKISDAMRPQVINDFQGRPVGRMPGMQINPDWDPAQAATRKDIQVENYATMIQHVHDGKSMISANTGKPATMDVSFNWPGGDMWKGATIDVPGRGSIPLEKSFTIGSGQKVADIASNVADAVAPYWANKFHVTPNDARKQVLNRLTQDFQKAHPTHLVNAGEILRSPDLDGLAVEGTYLRMVGDANPVLKWLGTGQSVASRIPSETGEFTHFQSSKAFPSGTVSGVNPSDVQRTHFNGLEDDVIGPHAGLLRSYDTITSLIRMGKLFNFTYHPVFNVHPALTNLLLDTAGTNPTKILKYTGILDAALLGASTTAGREAVTTARDLFKGGSLMGHEPQMGAKWDVPSDWLRDAEKWGVTSKGSFGTGVPIDQYVHLFSSPMDELNIGEKAQRVVAAGSQWNQNLTFNVMESRMTAAVHHILTHDEGMAPHESARTINKSINDYNNLTDIERNPALARIYWFYAFKKMMMRQAAVSLAKRANTLGTESRTIQQWNQQNNQAEAGDRTIALPQAVSNILPGHPNRMSASMAPYRFGLDVSNLTGIGGQRLQGQAVWSLAAGTLAPVPDAVARGMATANNLRKGTSVTPQVYDPTTGYFDTKQPIDVQIQQTLGIAGNEFSPVPMSPTPTMYSGLQPKQYGQLSAAATNLRNVTRYMNPQLQRRSMALVQRLDNGDMSAIGQAHAIYSMVELSRKSGY